MSNLQVWQPSIVDFSGIMSQSSESLMKMMNILESLPYDITTGVIPNMDGDELAYFAVLDDLIATFRPHTGILVTSLASEDFDPLMGYIYHRPGHAIAWTVEVLTQSYRVGYLEKESLLVHMPSKKPFHLRFSYDLTPDQKNYYSSLYEDGVTELKSCQHALQGLPHFTC